MKNTASHRKIRGKNGRPTKLNEELQKRICDFLRQGAYVETAAAAAGIRKDAFYDWLKKGAANPKSIYGQFSDAVAKAMADAELNDLICISVAAKKGNWSAAAWRLERRNPKRWGVAKRFPDDDDDDSGKGFTLNYSLDDD